MNPLRQIDTKFVVPTANPRLKFNDGCGLRYAWNTLHAQSNIHSILLFRISSILRKYPENVADLQHLHDKLPSCVAHVTQYHHALTRAATLLYCIDYCSDYRYINILAMHDIHVVRFSTSLTV